MNIFFNFSAIFTHFPDPTAVTAHNFPLTLHDLQMYFLALMAHFSTILTTNGLISAIFKLSRCLPYIFSAVIFWKWILAAILF